MKTIAKRSLGIVAGVSLGFAPVLTPAQAASSVAAVQYENTPLGPRGTVILEQLNQVRAWNGLPAIEGERGWCQRQTALQLAAASAFQHGSCDSVLARGHDVYDFGRAWNESDAHRELILQATSARIASSVTSDGQVLAVVELRY